MGPDAAESQVKKAIRKSPYSVASRGPKRPRAAGDGTMTQRADPRRVGLAAELTPPPRRPCRRQSTATLFERRADLLRGEIGQSAPRFGNQAAPATREPHEATPYTATAARPSAWPTTIAVRDTGATSTPCRKPECRSSTVEMVAKIAVKRRTSARMPG